MRDIDIIRAWKDEDYRSSLSEEERNQLPENPAGQLEFPAVRSFPVIVTMVTLPILYPPALTSTYYTITLINSLTSLIK